MTLTVADIQAGTSDDGVVTTSSGPRSAQPRRRAFAPQYKLRILAEYDRAATPGERGALLRREGLYHSHLIEWRKARDAGMLVAGSVAEQPEVGQGRQNEHAVARRRRRTTASAEQAELEQLRRQNEKLAKDLARIQSALEIMGKVVLACHSTTNADDFTMKPDKEKQRRGRAGRGAEFIRPPRSPQIAGSILGCPARPVRRLAAAARILLVGHRRQVTGLARRNRGSPRCTALTTSGWRNACRP